MCRSVTLRAIQRNMQRFLTGFSFGSWTCCPPSWSLNSCSSTVNRAKIPSTKINGQGTMPIGDDCGAGRLTGRGEKVAHPLDLPNPVSYNLSSGPLKTAWAATMTCLRVEIPFISYFKRLCLSERPSSWVRNICRS
jgi:hypothetical protein